jgi:hypothetical protein
VDYGNLINRAFKITWDHKILWVLGFLATSFSGSNGIKDLINKESIPELSAFHIGLIILLALFILVIGLVFLVLQLISVAGLIKAVFIIENKESFTLGGLFKSGAGYFWRYLGLFAIFLLIVIGLILLLAVPVIVGFTIAKALGIVALVLMIPLIFLIIFVTGNIYSLAQREIVVENLPPFDALSNAFDLLKKNLGPNIIIFLISMFLFLGTFLAGLLFLAVFALPTIYVGTQSTMYLIITIIIVAPILLLAFIVLAGFIGTFFNVLFTLFYQELKKTTPPRITRPDMINPAS